MKCFCRCSRCCSRDIVVNSVLCLHHAKISLLNVCDNYTRMNKKSKCMAFQANIRSYLRVIRMMVFFVLGIIQSFLFSLALIWVISLMRPLWMMMILCVDANSALLINLIIYCAISKIWLRVQNNINFYFVLYKFFFQMRTLISV